MLTCTIFAKNEAPTIAACIESVRGQADKIYVMVNGSTDGTVKIADKFGVWVSQTSKADKAAAWNFAVHHVIHRRNVDAHFFVDGYATVLPGSFAAMAREFNDPVVNAVSAAPASGRSRDALRERLARCEGLHGSLFALSGDFVARIQRLGIRLPAGLYRGDGLIASMALHDLDHTKPWDYRHIRFAPDAGWTFPGLSPLRPADWRRWLTRRRNQRLGVEQNARLRAAIYRDGFTNLPKSI